MTSTSPQVPGNAQSSVRRMDVETRAPDPPTTKLKAEPEDGPSNSCLSTGSTALRDEREIRRLTISIVRIQQALHNLEQSMLQQTTDGQLYKTVQKLECFSRTLDAMEAKRRSLEWRKLARSRAFGFSPDNMESIRRICKEIGSTMTVIAAFSATVSVSILFSAVRGNILFFYASWWCAIISLTSSLVLGALRDTNRPPRPIDWLKLHLSGLLALLCLLSAIASVISMSYGVIFFDVSKELSSSHNEPHIDSGPTIPKGVATSIVVVATAIMVLFFAGIFISFIRPFQVAHQKYWAQEAEEKCSVEKRRSIV